MNCKYCGVEIHYHEYSPSMGGNWVDSMKNKNGEQGTACCPNGVKCLEINNKEFAHEPETKEQTILKLINEVDRITD